MRQEWVGKRQAVRTNVQLRAQMRFGAGRPPVDCIVMDISLTGARIITPDDGPYPNDFDVYIPARSETKWARVRWREKQQLGVEFLKVRQDDRDGVEAAVLDRVMRLEDRLSAAQPAPPSLNADLVDRFAELEARLEARLDVAPAAASDADERRFAALSDRLAHIESRLAGAGAGADEDARASVAPTRADERRLDEFADRLGRLEAAAQTGAAPPGDANVGAPAQSEASDARLRGLEASVEQLRASLRTLILLAASQIKRSGA